MEILPHDTFEAASPNPEGRRLSERYLILQRTIEHKTAVLLDVLKQLDAKVKDIKDVPDGDGPGGVHLIELNHYRRRRDQLTIELDQAVDELHRIRNRLQK